MHITCIKFSLITYRQLDHPNIVKFYGCTKMGDEYVIVMKYICDSNLDNLILGKNKVEVNMVYVHDSITSFAYSFRTVIRSTLLVKLGKECSTCIITIP